MVESPIYGEGFGAVYGSERYAVFSRFLARLALTLLEEHGVLGGSLLDLACGAGAGTVVLARAGFRVCAVDGSATMVARTVLRTQAADLAVEVDCQDMRSLSMQGRFEAVTCLFDSLNYILSEDELVQVFSRIAAALVPEGILIFDMNTPHGLATRWGTRDVLSTARNDLFEINRNRYDTKREINTTTTIVFVHDPASGLYRRYTEIHRQRGYAPEKVVALLERARSAAIARAALSWLLSSVRVRR